MICKVNKPSGNTAKTLAKLFPSFTNFDLQSECSTTLSHMKKQKFVPKYSMIEVVMLKRFQSYIPKGDCRQHLMEEGHIKKVQLGRHMSPLEVKSKIFEEFKCMLLDCTKNQLCKASDTHLTAIVDVEHSMSKGKGEYTNWILDCR